MRRIIAMLLVIVMLVGIVPAQAFATENQTQATEPCITEGCTYGAGHTGECSTFVACGKDDCTYEAGHLGNCSTYAAPTVEAAADASVYVTVSDRGELGMAYEEITVTDINRDGKLSVDEALYAAHSFFGKGYASENGVVTKLWDVETANVSFFVNHEPVSSDVSTEDVREGDYLVASVDRDTVNDYDKYSYFTELEMSVSAGQEFTLNLIDDEGNALAGMEIGLWDGSGSTTMTGLTTDINGAVTLTLNQEGQYCVTAKGTVMESSIDVNTMEITSIETPIIAPVCEVTVSGNAEQQLESIITDEITVPAPVMFASRPRTVAEGETELSVSGGTITMAPNSTLGPATLTTLSIYKQNAYTEIPIILGATQNGTTINVVLAEDTDPSYPLQAGFACSGGSLRQSGNKCTLNAGQGTMSVVLTVYPGPGAPQPVGSATYTINFFIPMGEACTVNTPIGEGFTFTGKDSVYEGKDYTFSLAVNEGYDGTNMVVKVNGEIVTGTNGTYTVAAVSENLEITVEGVVKKELCTVTLTEGEGYTISSGDIPYKGEDYTFTVAADTVHYKAATLQVLLNGEPISGTDGTYTIPALAADHVVTVNIEKKAEYTVTKTGMDGVTITGADKVLETDPYTFSVTIDNAYDSSEMVITVNDEPITLDAAGSYTIASAGENIAIVVTGVKAKTVYNVILPEGENYTITGQATSYAGEPYTFTVTVDDAIYFADRIVVKVNDETVTLTDGKYTIEALSGDTEVTVENVVERTLFTVIKPEVEGVAFTGDDSVREGKPYTFSISVDDSYDTAHMEVTVNGAAVTFTDGSYTVESVAENLVIAVTGVEKKQVCNISLPTGKGYTVSGPLTAYKGDTYTFTVRTTAGYTDANMVVTANGETVNGTGGSYSFPVSGDITIEVTGVERESLPEKELQVNGNVIDITDKKLNPRNSYHATATDIQISGVAVESAFEDGTNVYILLPSFTEDDAAIDVKFGYTYNQCDMLGYQGSCVLENGDGSLTMTLTASYLDGWRTQSATYNLIFFRKEAATEVPSRVMDPDPEEIWGGQSCEIDLNPCFTGANTYYLVEGDSRTKVENGKYTFTGTNAGAYTLVFSGANEAGECPDHVTVTVTVKGPECLQESDAVSTYTGVSSVIDVTKYFAGASSYYLIQGTSRTEVTDGKYNFTTSEAGEHTLVFAAANGAGESAEQVTITITVAKLEGGIYIGHTTSSGSMNFVQFYDETGALIQELSASLDGRNIHVVLPKNYSPTGKVKAVFDLTRNNGDFPFITTSTGTAGTSSSQATGQKFTEKTTTLSAGKGKLTFYYYNQNHKDRKYDTFTLSYTIANDLPILSEGISATAEATITAGEKYTLDLTTLFTDVDGDPMTYLVSIDGAAPVAADAAYSYTNNVAGTYTLVFTANDGKGTSTASYTVTLTVENAAATKSMTVSLPVGLEPKFYASTGFGTDGTDILGDEILSIKGQNGYILSYPTNVATISIRDASWGGMTFLAEADTTVTLRQVQMSVMDYDNNPAESTNTVTYDSHKAFPGTEGWLLVTGKEYTFAAVPKDSSLAAVSMVEMVQPGEGIHTVNAMLGISNPISITVPNAATARLYSYDTGKYYMATELAAKIVKDNGNGTTTYSFVGDTKANGSCYIYQVSMPGKITKAGYLNWGQQTLTVSYTDTDKSNTYRLDDYSAAGEANSSIADDGVMLNINSRNHLSMSVGESKTLKAYRIWEIIKLSYQNYIITPEFTYTILSGNDVVSLTQKDSPSAGEGDWMTLTALKEGVAVIEVTYDAMEVTGGNYGGSYGATDPARTGLVVVQVGGADTSVDFGIESFASRGISGSNNISYNKNAKRAWDAEFDTLYFTGSSGQLKFSPAAGSDIVQVEVSNDQGNSWTELEAAEGVYTAPIVSGNNILRVTTLNGTAYQVVRGDKVTAQINEATGDGDNHIEPGETVRVTLNGLHIPIPKMAGNYNPGFYGNNDGFSSIHLNYSVGNQKVYGPGTQYNFITAANYLEIAIPEDWNSNTMTLSDGYIGLGVLGLTTFDTGGDSHRNIPDTGCATRGNETTFHTRSILPEITIPVAGVKVPVAVTGVALDKKELNLNVGDTQHLTATVSPADADDKEVTWSSENASVATAVNGEVKAIGAGTTVITVTTKDGEKTASCTVTVKQPVQSITVTPATAEVEVGKTVTLTAEVLPENATDKSVSWTSSDETIATVENGQVTGVKAGTVTITAQAGDKTATCSITIKAVEIPFHSAEVYFSVSHDDQFLKAEKTGAVMALQKLTVPYFDLSQYGLGAFSLPTTHADCGKPTMLHLYIYATEVLYYGLKPEEAGNGYLAQYLGSDVFAVSGGPGSVCVDQFWGMDMNLNYYHNYIFPAEESGTGITADRVILKDGDIVTIGHFTSWKFFGDPSSIFNYLVADGDTVVTTAAQNDPLMLQIYRAGPDLGAGGSNTPVKGAWDIYYVKAEHLSSGNVTSWTKLGTTDASGALTADLSDLPVGQYVLAVAGQKGEKYPQDIVSTPGGIVLNVTENTLPVAVQAVIAQIKAIGDVTLEKSDLIADACDAYEALSDAEKSMVSNYAVLEAAEKTLEELLQGQAAIQAVIDQISAIDRDEEITLDDETRIQNALDAYAALTDAQKELVINYSSLLEAKAELDLLKAVAADKEAAKAVIDLIEGIGDVSLDSEEAIQEALAAYDALTDSQRELVTNYEVLTEAAETLRLLKLDGYIAEIYQTTGKYLSELDAPGVGNTDGEWRVIGLSRAGRSVPDAYYEAVVAYVQDTIDANGRLHKYKSSDNSRIILALTAIGKDVTDVGGYDLLSGLDNMEYIGNQGINGYIWALIAFDSHDYPIPAGDVTREKLVNAILTEQKADGGWALAGDISDPDMTGMALAALAPYRSDANVAAAAEKALECLSDMQNEDGTFSSITEGVTCESLAQVVTGLTALGINPKTDQRFIKNNGISAMDAFASFYVEDGGFRHSPTGDRNMMATEQGYYALVSYFRLLNDENALYDMSDVTIETSAANQEAANRVIGLINAIGIVDLTKEDKIDAARKEYDDLTDTQKSLISPSTYKILTDAETALAQLKQTAADTAAADVVKDLIDAIGTVDLTKEDEIDEALKAYNRLTRLQKNLVGEVYFQKLKDAEEELKSQKQEAQDAAAVERVIELINKIPTNRNINENDETVILNAHNAYNGLRNDTLRNRVSNRAILLDAVKALNELKSCISVTFTLLGCYKHGSGETTVHTLAKGNLQTWIAARTYKVKPGATVKDLLEQALATSNMTPVYDNSTKNYVAAITRNGDTIGEFTNGKNSGWMYTLNGKHPGLGVNQQTLVNGDKVVFHYTDDYTKEKGSASGSTTGTTTGTSTGTVSGSTNYITTTATKVSNETAESVDRLIEDIGEEITLESEDKILAARAAYDKLTEAQKKLVKNYEDLVAAEAKLAELKGASGEDVYEKTGDYIQELGTPGVGNVGGEWMVIGLARSGRSVPTGYYDHVLSYVRANINDKEQLHSAKSSDNSRLILALTAIGKDVTDVDGHNLLRGLNDMDYIQKQGINGPIWALLAFDSGNYPVPEGNVSREALIDVILKAQLFDGGWALSGERSDPDMTGMAIQALAPYMESRMDVQKAIEAAIWTLSKLQNDNGSFTSVDGPNSESIAQVIVALAALGIDADTDARFVKNGISALDALMTYYIPGGGFRHVLDGNLDGMATEQAFYALVAYERMKQNQNFLYDMTDVLDAGGDVIVEETTEATEAPKEPVEVEEEDNGNAVVIWTGVMTLCAAAIAVLLLNRKKFFGKFM